MITVDVRSEHLAMCSVSLSVVFRLRYCAASSLIFKINIPGLWTPRGVEASLYTRACFFGGGLLLRLPRERETAPAEVFFFSSRKKKGGGAPPPPEGDSLRIYPPGVAPTKAVSLGAFFFSRNSGESARPSLRRGL